jgi:hypothetical protein
MYQLSGQNEQKAPVTGRKPPAESAACKAVTHWGIKGCERFTDGSCPKGHTQHVACPANPMIKAPCYLMCVPTPKKESPTNTK